MLHPPIRHLLRVLIWVALMLSVAYCQDKQSQPEKLAYGADRANVPDAIAKLKAGDFLAVHVDLIVGAGATEAIPALEKEFGRVQDPLLKAKIAGGLLRLGDKDNAYWDFLVQFAAPAIESDAPNFMEIGPDGKFLPGPSADFIAWAKGHNLSTESPGENSVYLLPAKVILLGWSGDPRGIPLLRRALLSPNYQVEIAAALGLAEIGDQDSVPFIVEACRKAPADAAAVIAQSLIYFDTPEAQGAVDRYIPKDIAKIYRDARAHGKTSPLSDPLYDKVPNQ